MKTKLEINLSASALGHSGCVLNFYRTVVGSVNEETGQSEGGYKEPAMSSRIVYGVAVHKFLDTAYKTGGNLGEAVKEAKLAFALPKVTDRKAAHLEDERHLMTVCFNLWTGFCQEDGSFELLVLGGVPSTEITFRIHFYEDDNVIVYLCGTIDKIGQFKGGCFAIGDWKTTSSWDNSGYFKRYELSKQLRLYTLACKLQAQREPESTLGKIGATKMGCFIDAIFLKPSANDTVVRRSEVYQIGDKEILEFENGVLAFCRNLSYHIEHSISIGLTLPKEGIVNGSCEGKWGLCQFWNVCKAPDNVAQVLLARDFKRALFTPWNYNDL